MTPEIEAAIKGHPDTITAHGILAREITDLRARLSEAEAEKDACLHLLQQHDAHWHEIAQTIGTYGGYGGVDGPVKEPLGNAFEVVKRVKEIKAELQEAQDVASSNRDFIGVLESRLKASEKDAQTTAGALAQTLAALKDARAELFYNGYTAKESYGRADGYRVRLESVQEQLTEMVIAAGNYDKQAREEKRKREEAERDSWAYQGALGYPVPGWHDGRKTDGTIPECGLCDARNRVLLPAQEKQEKI